MASGKSFKAFFFFKVNARSVRGLHKSIPAIFLEFEFLHCFLIYNLRDTGKSRVNSSKKL